MSGAVPLLPYMPPWRGQGQHNRNAAATVTVRSMY